MRLHVAVVFLALQICPPAAEGAPSHSEFGEPAPEWLRRAEVYNSWYSGWTDHVIATRLTGFPLIAGVPHSKEWVDKAHRGGLRVIPYVTFYKGLNISRASKVGWPDPMMFRLSPFFCELNWENHPEWLLYTEKGAVRRPFDLSAYPGGWEQVCTNSPGFQAAALRAVRLLMEMGVDGLFIDNVHPTEHCFGPQFGKHIHVEPAKDHEVTFNDLLQKVYNLVKSYDKQRVIILNGGKGEWRAADGKMYESFVCSSAAPECSRDFDRVYRWARANEAALRSGKVIVALSYLGDVPYDTSPPAPQDLVKRPPASKEDVYYCYSAAKLFDFLWGDHFTLRPENPARNLLEIRLGRALEDLQERPGAYFKNFEHGLVIVNPRPEKAKVEIPVKKAGQLRDLFAETLLQTNGKIASLEIPAQSGRVYLFESGGSRN